MTPRGNFAWVCVLIVCIFGVGLVAGLAVGRAQYGHHEPDDVERLQRAMVDDVETIARLRSIEVAGIIHRFRVDLEERAARAESRR